MKSKESKRSFGQEVRDGIEPSFKDLQSTTFPLCYLTYKKVFMEEFKIIDGEYNLVGKSVRL